MDFEKISSEWQLESKIYEMLGSKVTQFIKKEIPNYEILPEVTYRTKDIISIIKKIKKKSHENPTYSLADLKDKLGLRIICSFSSDLEIVDKFLYANFDVKKADYKKDVLDFDKLDYTSNHYDVEINPKNNKLRFRKGKFENLVFEFR